MYAVRAKPKKQVLVEWFVYERDAEPLPQERTFFNHTINY